MERHYEGNNILLLESGAHAKSIQICFAFLNIYGGFNIWQDLEHTGRITAGKLARYIAIAHVRKVSSLQMCR